MDDRNSSRIRQHDVPEGYAARPVVVPPLAQEAPWRSGTPWTEDDLVLLVAQVRRGADEATTARCLARVERAVVQRLRRMLPLEHRGCPADQVFVAARKALQDPEYDWREALLLSVPPPPVVNPPAMVSTGIEGLDDDQLATVAYALLCSQGPRVRRMLEAVSGEVARRRVCADVLSLAVRHVQRRAAGYGDAARAAAAWIESADGWTGGEFPRSRSYYPGEEPSPGPWAEPAAGW